MDSLWRNKKKLMALRRAITGRDPQLFTCTPFTAGDSAITVSIVMCSYNRSEQTYFTLGTITHSARKDVQVILVDDSTTDLLDPEVLAAFPLRIDFVRIDPDKKTWCNPCVNYNIGFQYIQGTTVIIQNPEVCHVGDVLSYTVDHLTDETYMVFNVRACKDCAANQTLYTMRSSESLDTRIFDTAPRLFGPWLQHPEHRNKNLHFLIGCRADRVCGFSYDMAFGTWYDDDDFVFQMTVVHHLRIHNVHHETAGVAGIHLYHGGSGAWNIGREMNTSLWIQKVKYFQKTGQYMEVSSAESVQDFENRWKSLLMI